MSRISVAALLLGLAAAPAFASSEDEAARSLQAQTLRQNTLQQNQRAVLAPPPRLPAAQSQPGRTPAVAAPAAPSRRLAAADQPRR